MNLLNILGLVPIPLTFGTESEDMPLLLVHSGGLRFLADALAAGEDWQLCLYTAAVSGTESSVADDFTAGEATFAGYSRKTLTREVGTGKWAVPSLAAPS